MLRIQEEIVGQYGVLHLCGRFDFYGTEAFKAKLKEMERKTLPHLIIDFSEVPLIDSVSLGVLVSTQKRFARAQKSIYVVIDPENGAGKVMSHASLQTLMPTFHSKKDAISSLTSSVSQS